MAWYSGITNALGDVGEFVVDVGREGIELAGDVLSGDILGAAGNVYDIGAVTGGYIADIAGAGGRNQVASPASSTAHTAVNGAAMSQNGTITRGPANLELVKDPVTGATTLRKCYRRRRRRRLLTAQDKADLAFLIGQLGTGQAGKAAISALLSRRL